MKTEIPEFLTLTTVSILRNPKGSHPSERRLIRIPGIVVDNGVRKFVIGSTYERTSLDHLIVESITGVPSDWKQIVGPSIRKESLSTCISDIGCLRRFDYNGILFSIRLPDGVIPHRLRHPTEQGVNSAVTPLRLSKPSFQENLRERKQVFIVGCAVRKSRCHPTVLPVVIDAVDSGVLVVHNTSELPEDISIEGAPIISACGELLGVVLIPNAGPFKDSACVGVSISEWKHLVRSMTGLL